MRYSLGLLTLLLLGLGAWAEDSLPTTVQQAAERVAEVAAKGDDTALEALTGLPRIDPWAVADELCGQGRFDAAERYATSSTAPDLAGLGKYVAGRRARPADDGIRAARTALTEPPTAGEAPPLAPAELADDYLRARMADRRARALHRAGDTGGAVIAYVAAADSAERAGWLRGSSNALARAGETERNLAHFAASIALHERLLDLMVRRGRQLMVARVAYTIGGLRTRRGDFDLALEWFARARTEARLLEGGRREQMLAMTDEAESTALRELGRLADAVAQLQSAIEVYDRLAARSAASHARATLGGVHIRLGEYARAVEILEPLLAQIDELPERSRPRLRAVVHGNLGVALRSLRRPTDAEPHLVKAVEEWARGGRGPEHARAALALAWLEIDEGRVNDALTRLAPLDRVWESAGNRSARAEVMNAIGHARMVEGQYGEAVAAYTQALLHLEGTPADALAYSVRSGLARTELARGRPTDALRYARAAIADVDVAVTGLSDESAASSRMRLRGPFEIAVQAALAEGNEGALFELLERGRAGALLTSLAGRRSTQDASAPGGEPDDESELRRREAEALALLHAARNQPDAKLKEIRTRKHAFEAARDELAAWIERDEGARARRANRVYPEPASLAEVQAALGPTDALVSYAVLRDEYGVVPGVAFALVVRHDAVGSVKLEAPDALEAACDIGPLRAADGDPAKCIARLRAALIDPLALPATTRRVFLSPDAFLHRVPFAALLDDRSVGYVPSATTWIALRADEPSRATRILALGDPAYGGEASSPGTVATRSGAIAELARLPHTRVEVETVASGDDDVRLLDVGGTESALRSAIAKADRWRAIHLACHGLLDTERPMRSALALTPSAEDDGLLTALQVTQMRVPADLVALSACDTGRGREVSGEGLLGLTRAFLLAGSSRVLVSLWPADDRATSALMTKFYELWRDGEVPAATALHRAQRHVAARKGWEHPRYWAGWSLWGLAR